MYRGLQRSITGQSGAAERTAASDFGYRAQVLRDSRSSSWNHDEFGGESDGRVEQRSIVGLRNREQDNRVLLRELPLQIFDTGEVVKW